MYHCEWLPEGSSIDIGNVPVALFFVFRGRRNRVDGQSARSAATPPLKSKSSSVLSAYTPVLHLLCCLESEEDAYYS